MGNAISYLPQENRRDRMASAWAIGNSGLAPEDFKEQMRSNQGEMSRHFAVIRSFKEELETKITQNDRVREIEDQIQALKQELQSIGLEIANTIDYEQILSKIEPNDEINILTTQMAIMINNGQIDGEQADKIISRLQQIATESADNVNDPQLEQD